MWTDARLLADEPRLLEWTLAAGSEPSKGDPTPPEQPTSPDLSIKSEAKAESEAMERTFKGLARLFRAPTGVEVLLGGGGKASGNAEEQ